MPENILPPSKKGAKQKVQQNEVKSWKKGAKNSEKGANMTNNEKSGKVKKVETSE